MNISAWLFLGALVLAVGTTGCEEEKKALPDVENRIQVMIHPQDLPIAPPPPSEWKGPFHWDRHQSPPFVPAPIPDLKAMPKRRTAESFNLPSGPVVSVPPQTPDAKTKGPAPLLYTILAASFYTREAAESGSKRLSFTGLPTKVVEEKIGPGTYYLVYLGTFDDLDRAEAYAILLQEKGTINDYYIRKWTENK